MEGGQIVAIVCIKRERIAGGAPIFYVKDENELQEIANMLEKILDVSAHELDKELMILVKYS